MENQINNSLFEQIGGMKAVNVAVDIFYSKVESDERINHFFRWIDMDTQSHKLKTFLAYAFGADLPYSGKSMKVAHAHLVEKGLNAGHFDAVMEHLVATLQELGVPDALIQQAGVIAESTRNDVLGKA